MLIFRPGPAHPFDQATLNGTGHFATDANNGRRRLFFRLYLLKSRPQGFLRHHLSVLSPIPDVEFEVRPDLPYSLIGRDRWVAFRSALGGRGMAWPTYEQACEHPGLPVIGHWFKDMRLAMHWIALDHPDYPGRVLPPVEPFFLRVGLHNDLNPAVCIIGADLLQHGLVAWFGNSTYFFGARCDPNDQNRIDIANGMGPKTSFRNPAPSLI